MTGELEIPENLSEWTKGGITEALGTQKEHTDEFYRHGNLGAELHSDGIWAAYAIVDGHPIMVRDKLMSFAEVVEFFKGSFCSKRLSDGEGEEKDDVPDVDEEPEFPSDGEMGITIMLKSITEMMSPDYDGVCAVRKGTNLNHRKPAPNLTQKGRKLYNQREDINENPLTKEEQYNNRSPKGRKKRSTYSKGPIHQRGIPKNALYGKKMNRIIEGLNNPATYGNMELIENGGIPRFVNNQKGARNPIAFTEELTPNQTRYLMFKEISEKSPEGKNMLARGIYSPYRPNKNAIDMGHSSWSTHKKKDSPDKEISQGTFRDGGRATRLINPRAMNYISSAQISPQVKGTAGQRYVGKPLIKKEGYAKGTNPGNLETVGDINAKSEFKMPGVKYRVLDELMNAIANSEDPRIAGHKETWNKYNDMLVALKNAVKEYGDDLLDSDYGMYGWKEGDKKSEWVEPDDLFKAMAAVNPDYEPHNYVYSKYENDGEDLSDLTYGDIIAKILREVSKNRDEFRDEYDTAIDEMADDTSFTALHDWLATGRPKDARWMHLPYSMNVKPPMHVRPNKTGEPYKDLSKDRINWLVDEADLYTEYDDDIMMNPLAGVNEYSELYSKYDSAVKRDELNRRLAQSILNHWSEPKSDEDIADNPDMTDFTDLNLSRLGDPMSRSIAKNHIANARRMLDEADTGDKSRSDWLYVPTEDDIISMKAHALGGVPVKFFNGKRSSSVSGSGMPRSTSKDASMVDEDSHRMTPRMSLKDMVQAINYVAAHTGMQIPPSFRKNFEKKGDDGKIRNILLHPLNGESMSDEEVLGLREIVDSFLNGEGKAFSSIREGFTRPLNGPHELVERMESAEDFTNGQIDKGFMSWRDGSFYLQDIYDTLVNGHDIPDEYRLKEYERAPAPKVDSIPKEDTIPEPLTEQGAPNEEVNSDTKEDVTATQGPLTELGKEITESEDTLTDGSENPLMKSITDMISEKHGACYTTPPEEYEMEILNENPRSIIIGAGKMAIPDPQHVVEQDIYRTYSMKDFPKNFPGKD